MNPYLGSDSVEPFLQACRRTGTGIFCLVKTSNAGGADVQDLTLSDGRPLWQQVAALVKEWGEELVGEHGLSNVGAVVGATHPRAVGEARRLMPQAILLLPGVGAQGATPGGRRARVHERPGERARDRLPLRHVRGEGGRRELAPRRGRGGAATRARGLGRRRVVIDRQQVARFAAPAAFLLAVTILVLLVRSATSDDEPRHGDRRRRRHRHRPRPRRPPRTRRQPTRRPPPRPSASTYTIEAGDTLQTIADQYGTTVEELLALNPDVDPTALQIGQTIRVP